MHDIENKYVQHIHTYVQSLYSIPYRVVYFNKNT